jgi:hypothetical protein
LICLRRALQKPPNPRRRVSAAYGEPARAACFSLRRPKPVVAASQPVRGTRSFSNNNGESLEPAQSTGSCSATCFRSTKDSLDRYGTAFVCGPGIGRRRLLNASGLGAVYGPPLTGMRALILAAPMWWHFKAQTIAGLALACNATRIGDEIDWIIRWADTEVIRSPRRRGRGLPEMARASTFSRCGGRF